MTLSNKKTNVKAKTELQHARFVASGKNITGYIVLTFEYHKEGNTWVVNCRELGTSTFGRTLSAAKERIRDAIICHLNCLEDVGERERFFRENHIRLYSEKPKTLPKINITGDGDVFYQSQIQPILCGEPA